MSVAGPEPAASPGYGAIVVGLIVLAVLAGSAWAADRQLRIFLTGLDEQALGQAGATLEQVLARQRDHAHLQPERGELAQGQVIDDGLEADVIATILAGQHRKIDGVLDDAIAVEEIQAGREEAAAQPARTRAIPAIEPDQADQGRGDEGENVPAHGHRFRMQKCGRRSRAAPAKRSSVQTLSIPAAGARAW